MQRESSDGRFLGHLHGDGDNKRLPGADWRGDFMDGSTTLGTGTLNGFGVATYTTSSLAVGQHSITAVYGGDANNAGSTSAVLTQTVNRG